MKNFYLYLILAFGLISCAVEEDIVSNPFVIAFESPSTNFAKIQNSEPIVLVFSEFSKSAGFIKIRVETTGIFDDSTFNTYPEIVDNSIILAFDKSVNSLSFDFISLLENYSEEDQDKEVKFIIEEINYLGYSSIQGYSVHNISFNTVVGGVVEPNIGGANEQNQVYFDLSTRDFFSIQRDAWDLGFYSGEDFRVILNGSIYMATKALDFTDINTVTEENIPSEYYDEVKIGTFNPDNIEFIDNPSGNLNETAIQEITIQPENNSVYLLNLGYEVGTTAPNNGSVAVAGAERGWKKIKVIRQEGGYLLQYADLNETTHQEIFIPKDTNYHFTHFSFNSESVINAQPYKEDWDLCFTVFTNIVYTPNGESAGSYGFSDFIVNNILADAKAFMVEDASPTAFDEYVLNIDEANQLLSNDQRAIGDNWRDVFNGLYTDRFFVLNDTEANWYKIRFIAFTNENGTRGFPKFEYQLIN